MKREETATGWPAEDLEALALRLARSFPPLSREEGRIALAVFREMASGRPADLRRVAERAGAPEAAVAEAAGSWPGVYRDEEGSIRGFWGLALDEMPHPMHVGGQLVYGWCAWDTLFLGELIGEEVRVESTCASTGSDVRLKAGPGGVREVDPPDAVISMVDPDQLETDGDRVISSFCHHIRYFSSPETWREWEASQPGETFMLTVGDAWVVGNAVNRIRFATALAETGRRREVLPDG